MSSHKWALKIALGGLMGAIGMSTVHKLLDMQIGWYYHAGQVSSYGSFFLGAMIGMVVGVVNKDFKKLLAVSLVVGILCMGGHYLLMQIEKSGYLGEAAVIVVPILSVIILASFIAAGVGIGQKVLLSQKIGLGANALDIVLRMLCGSSLCLIFISFFYGNRGLDFIVSGFVLGCGSYLIGERYN